MSKRDRPSSSDGSTIELKHTRTASPGSIQEHEFREKQKLISRISAQTAVDPSDQLRSDQFAFVPRSYQLELAELAKAGNVLVCLDTGSGKTFISVLLLQHMHMHKPVPSSGLTPPPRHKVSFFLVNLVPLVHQQSSVIAGNSNLAVGKLYGELKDSIKSRHSKLLVDNWRAPHWDALLQSHQVIVSTAQCFLDALIHGFIKMSDLCLIVFDEVHHALKNHPYFRIMKYYKLANEQDRPKIFGMTASPIFTGTGEFDQASRHLQKTMNARVHTVSNATLAEWTQVKQRPIEMVIEYEKYPASSDGELATVEYSDLTRQMIERFGAAPNFSVEAIDKVELDPTVHAFEAEVMPKIEYAMKQLGPIGCDVLWHSTLLEYRSRARKWINIAKEKRALVSDDWILESSMRTFAITPPDSQESSDDNQASTTALHLGAMAHLSTNRELNQQILLHMTSQPRLSDVLDIDSTNASPKLCRLIETLRCFEPSKALFCAIIFVERRQTATLLVELIKRVKDLDWIHPEFLLGHNGGSASSSGGGGGGPSMDWHDQVQVLNRFRRRAPTNLLVATSIAEEGLDIQAANLVVRFDLFNRHISFLQSRGRARAKQSRFICMVERANLDHARVILNAFNAEANRGRWLDHLSDAEHDVAFWQQRLKVEQEDEEEEAVVDAEACIYEPSTGARLYREDAPSLVSHYAATLHSEYLQDAMMGYKMEVIKGGVGEMDKYTCTLELPSTAAVRAVESGVCASKKQAKRLAAFKVCQKLRQLGELDEWLMPKLIAQVAVKEDQGVGGGGSINPHHKAWKGSGRPVHVPVKKLDGWTRFCSTDTWQSSSQGAKHFYATFLGLDAFDLQCQPLLLLTKAPLADTKLFSLLHPVSQQMKPINCKSFSAPILLPKDVVQSAKRLTQFMFTMISRRDIPHSAKGEPCLLIVPVRLPAGRTEVDSASELEIDMPSSLAFTPLPSNLNEGAAVADDLKNCILVRQHGFHSWAMYRFEVLRMDMTANSPISKGQAEAATTYLEQHLKMYGTYHASKDIAKEDIKDVLAHELSEMPLLQVTKLDKVQNLLTPLHPNAQPKPTTTTSCVQTRLIVPYFYKLHPLAHDLIASIHLLPSILTHYDQLLLAYACNTTLFGGQLDNDLVLEAITTPSAGMQVDYERLEFLGDTFLKLVATCYTFTTKLGRMEAELHMANKAILTNVRLLREASRVRLAQYAVLASSNFNPKRFVPPVFGKIGGVLTSRKNDDHDQVDMEVDGDERQNSAQWDSVKEKTLSDMVESLIGAALLGHGTATALHVCHVFHLIPDTIQKLSDFNTLLESLKLQSVEQNWEQRVSLEGLHHLETLFAHQYRYPHLGLEAFTHPSLLASILPSYQRLEFLGDAWLDFYIVQRIFKAHPDLTPGELTALKGVLASNATLSALGVKLGLHRYIASHSGVLCETIQKYVSALQGVSEGQAEGQYWLHFPMTVVPKVIADVMEASFASVVVDCGFDEEVSSRLFARVVAPFYDAHCALEMVRMQEVKRMVDIVLATMRRLALSGGRCFALQVCSNLIQDERAGKEAVGMEIGAAEEDEREGNLIRALLTHIWVELRVHGRQVARFVGLPKSVAHLDRCIGIMREIDQIQHRVKIHTGCAPSFGKQNEADGEQISLEANKDSGSAVVDVVDQLEHLLRDLVRILGWKMVHQTSSSASSAADSNAALSLTQLRGHVLKGCTC